MDSSIALRSLAAARKAYCTCIRIGCQAVHRAARLAAPTQPRSAAGAATLCRRRSHALPSAHVGSWFAPLCGLYVGVEAEPVRRIVTLLERGKPRVVVAVSGMHAGLAIVAGGKIHVLAARLWLDLRPGAPHPVDLARGVPGRHLPGREYPDVVTRPAVEVRGVLRFHAADRAALMLQPHLRAVRRRALGELDHGIDEGGSDAVDESALAVGAQGTDAAQVGAALQRGVRRGGQLVLERLAEFAQWPDHSLRFGLWTAVAVGESQPAIALRC